MKIAVILIGLLVVASATVFSQGKFTVKPIENPIYSYQVFEVRDPVPAPNAQATTPAAAIATRTNPTGRPPSANASLIQPGDRKFEIFCSDMGGRGFRLVHVIPGNGGFRAIFERETLPKPK